MDFGVDEELNYEEDLPEDDSVDDDFPSKVCTEDNDTLKASGCDDQYLRLDYSEDENLTSDETPEVTTPKSQSIEKATEKTESPNQENASTLQKDCIQPKDMDDKIVINKNKRKNFRPFQRRPVCKKKVTNALSFNPWLPEYNFSEVHNQRTRPVYENQTLNLNQKFYPIQNSTLPSLLNNSKRFLQSWTFTPISPVGIGISNRNFVHQRNPPTASLPFNTDLSNFQMEKGKMLFSRSFGFQNVEPKIFLKGNDLRKSSAVEQNFNRINQQSYAKNFQIADMKSNGLIFGNFYNRNINGIGAPLIEQGVKNYPLKNEDRFNNVKYKTLEDEEKKLLTLKKEARLKRFMNDGLVQKDKLTDSGFEESSNDRSPPKLQCVQKQGETPCPVKQQDENSDSDNDPPLGKPGINKELLLKKINPFELNLATSDYALTTKLKENVERIPNVKQERVDVKPQISVASTVEENLPKTEEKAPTLPLSVVSVKTENEPRVRFVRTISKSFDELTCRKPKFTEKSSNEPTPPGKLSPLMEVGKIARKENGFHKQMEPQLTGCIVKVLNIPPTTTTNDILALCSPIGIVMEVKLNFPKENSVVIRFAEPTCAENFFSLYHGQKMNNYFLNVIVV